MKRLTALVFVLALLCPLGITAAATDGGDTTMSYTVNANYTVTIPATVSGDSASLSIDAAPVLEEGQKVVISIADSANYDNGFRLKLKGADAYVGYTISDGANTLAMGSVVLEQPAAAEQAATVNLTFTPEKAAYAGDYSDTLTFTIAVADTATQ